MGDCANGCGVLLALTPADLPFSPHVIFCVCSPTPCTFFQAHLNLGSLTAQTLSTFSGTVSCFDLPELLKPFAYLCCVSGWWKAYKPTLERTPYCARDGKQCSCFAHSDSFVYSLVADMKVFRVLPVAGITMHFCLA
jgi:hypothetical protein